MFNLTVRSAVLGTASENVEVLLPPCPPFFSFFSSLSADERAGMTPGGTFAELLRSHSGILNRRSSSKVQGETEPG